MSLVVTYDERAMPLRVCRQIVVVAMSSVLEHRIWHEKNIPFVVMKIVGQSTTKNNLRRIQGHEIYKESMASSRATEFSLCMVHALRILQ